MSQIIPFHARQIDPLSEVLAGMDPANADALTLMREVFSNQIAIGAAVIALQRHAFNADNDVYELADSVAANALPRLEALTKDIQQEAV